MAKPNPIYSFSFNLIHARRAEAGIGESALIQQAAFYLLGYDTLSSP